MHDQDQISQALAGSGDQGEAAPLRARVERVQQEWETTQRELSQARQELEKVTQTLALIRPPG